MANIKNFGLAGIGSDVQFGKGGGRLIYDSSSSFFKFTTDGSTLAQIRVATTPSDANDVASKSYVDGAVTGLDVKNSVRAATTAAGTLASDFENGDTIDGVTLATGDRILIKDQATGSENGVYTVNASGAPTRATDFDADSEVTAGAFFFVEEGTTNADSGFVLSTNDDITVGSTALTFTQFSGTGQIIAGDGLDKSGSTLSVNVDNSTLEISSDTLQVHSSYAGQTSIDTLGTVTTGTWNATDIGVAHGGTGASTAADARTNLGLVIGTDVQAYDAQLADIAGLTPTDGNIIVGDGANFVAESGATARASLGLTIGTDVQAYDAQLADIAGLTPTDGNIIIGDGSNFVLESGATARASLGLTIGTHVQAQDASLQDIADMTHSDGSFIVSDGTNFVLEDGATARASLGLTIGTDVQAYDAQLADIAGMTPTDGNIIVGDGSNFVLESGATARTSLGLGTGDAVEFAGITSTANIDLGGTNGTDGVFINGLNTPTTDYQAATKKYVDDTLASSNTLAEMGDVNITTPSDAALLIYDTGTSTWRDADMSGDATISDTGVITLTDGASTRQNLGLEIGVDVQAYDDQLADIAGLTPTDGNFIVGDGTNFVLESGATARTSLGLGTIATQDANNVSISGGSISGVTTFSTGTLGSTATIDGDMNVTGNLTVDGNLTVSGSSITLDVGTVTTEDKFMVVNSGATTQETGLAGGLEIKRSNTADTDQFAFVSFDDSTDSFTFKTGSAGQASTTDATMRFGTVAAGTWNGTAIGRAYGGFGTSISGHGNNSLVEADGGEITVGTAGQYLRSDGTNYAASDFLASDLTGQVSLAGGGTGTDTSSFADDSIMLFDGAGGVDELAKGGVNTVLKVNGAGAIAYAKVGLTTDVTGLLPGANGGLGTDVSAFAASSIITTDGDGTVSELTKGSNNTVLKVNGSGTLSYASLDLANDVGSSLLGGANGGLNTDVSAFAADSLITTDGDDSVSELAKGSNNTVLKVNGSGTLQYAQVDVTADITGTVPVANGGTGLTAVGTVNKYLRSTGSVNQYDYVTALRDSSGNSIFEIDSANVADNTKIMVTNTSGEVTLQAIDPDDGTANIDLVLKGQGSGAVIINESSGGNSLIQADDTLDLTASGGVANGADAGDLVLKGGNGDGAYNSGDVLIKGGTGGAAEGKVKVLDSTNNEIAIFERTASAVNEVSITNAATGSGPSIAATGDDTNIDLVLSPKGTGVITVPSGYDANVSGDNDLVTKKWVEDNVVTSTDDLTIRTSVSSGSSSATIGTMPNAAGITYYISKVTVYVSTGFSGGSVDHITIGDGSYTFVEEADSDVATAGTYVVDLPFSTATAGGSTLTLNFLDSGAAAATPSGGAAVVTVEYKALS